MPKTTLRSFSLRPLSGDFVAPKPKQKAPLDVIAELESAGRLIMERKRQGHCIFSSHTGPHNRYVDLYSSGIHDLTRKLPNLTDQLRGMNIPDDTLLAGEGIITVNGVDSDSTFGRIAQSGPANAIALQKELGPVNFALFNVIVHKGKIVIDLPYADRLDILQNIVGRRPMENVSVVQVVDGTFAEAQALVRKEKWEGLVLYDRNAPSEYKLDGDSDDPPRPYGCWKWKPYDEDDFVATGWIPSTSTRYKGLVKDLLFSQYDPAGNLVSWGKTGRGLSVKQKRDLADDKYPRVFQLEFERRTPNNRLISASIKRERFDKNPGACVYPHP